MDDVVLVAHVHILIVGDLEGFSGQLVCSAQIPAGDFEESVKCTGVEGQGGGPGDAAAMLDVAMSLLPREGAQNCVVGKTPGNVLHIVAAERVAQLRLPGQDDAENKPAVHVEVGEDAQHGQRFQAQVVSLIYNQHWLQTISVTAVAKALLDAADQCRVSPGGGHPDGCSDLAAHVAFGEPGDFDVVSTKARSSRVKGVAWKPKRLRKSLTFAFVI